MVFGIEKFSFALCLVYSTNKGGTGVPKQCFELTNNSSDVLDVIFKLGDIFDNEFQLIMDKTMKGETSKSFESFMRATLSKYVKMSEIPTYFHFMLVCSLINAIVFENFVYLRCFTFAKVSSLCLIAVYERCYKDFFNEKEEFETLDSYCKRISPSILSEDGTSEMPVDHQELISLLSSVENIDYESFDLTENEVRMLDDAIDLVPPEEVPENSCVSTNVSCVPQSSSADEVNVEKKIIF
ncbi:hypothetical protein AVEN_261123-1 [Araneus ventricosus]|uniref:Uncharacterized protein n=1 Tax=Araneus ventricosus TaxID=182803 RepID=A0A4Y2JJY6_ARAVE|nr:hypothetical protein AVEN_261123-1 [Araneus ventricosus]